MKTVYIIIAFCIGLFAGHLLFPTEKEIKPPVSEAVEQTKEKLSIIDSSMFEGKVHFLTQNDSLIQKLSITNGLLTIHKSLLASERSKVKHLLDRMQLQIEQNVDTTIVDSLCLQINSLNAKTDSLVNHYERKDSLMQSMVAIRDSQIELCDQSYQQTKDLLLEQSKREQQLANDLNTALKQLKRKKWQSRLLSAGMLFISGITTTLYIKSRQ